jgi:hypothetical protein
LILLSILLAAPVQEASDWYALLQTRHTWECSADHLISGGGNGVLTDGLPLAAVGSIPKGLPWPDGATTDPLQSGIWGGGTWNASFTSGEFQDSASLSRIGLIQNTEDHSRYGFELDRPLPWGASGNFELMRNDTLSLHSAVIRRGNLDLRLSGWEGRSYGWGGWTGWKTGPAYARAGFSRLYADDRRPEFLGGMSGNIGPLEGEIGGAVALVDSSVEYRGALGLTMRSGDLSFTCAGDRRGEETGFWGGVTWNPGPAAVSAVHSDPADEPAFQLLSIRHRSFTLLGRFSSDPSAAADVTLSAGPFRGRGAAAWFFDSDSLAVNGHLLLGYDWYRGRIEAGPRLTASMGPAGVWDSTMDCVIGFTLMPFSIAAGIEDLTDPYGRSWSFGITWAFTDRAPQPAEGDEDGRGRG